MPAPDKYLILAADPDEGQWTILHQTDNADEAIDYWVENPADHSRRITLFTGDFITFDEAVRDDEEDPDGSGA